ncbi:MAG: hypothetical protein F9K44_03720 [Hyphomicrobiaceae bacterium]|nr:MAG: hypothetical protein F9K44_03720 [Hyphomicrobiaceae bacterium]
MSVMMQDPAIPERKRMEKFLPWYIAGRLSRDERMQVEEYLRRHPDFAPNVERVKSEHDELVQLYESLGAPRGGALAKLMTSIGEDGVRRIEAVGSGGLIARIGAWFKDLTPQQLAFAASVAVGVFVVQAAAITMLATKGRVQPTETAQSRPQATAQAPRLPTAAQPSQTAVATLARDAVVTGGSYLTVTFADTAKAPEIAAFLTRYGASVADVKDGKYRIKLLDLSAVQGSTRQGPPRDLLAVATQMRGEQSLVRHIEVMK